MDVFKHEKDKRDQYKYNQLFLTFILYEYKILADCAK